MQRDCAEGPNRDHVQLEYETFISSSAEDPFLQFAYVLGAIPFSLYRGSPHGSDSEESAYNAGD